MAISHLSFKQQIQMIIKMTLPGCARTVLIFVTLIIVTPGMLMMMVMMTALTGLPSAISR